jgi:hypothetical protein
MLSWGRNEGVLSVHFVRFRAVKPMNVWPMLILLVIVVLIIFWLGGAFAR